MEQKQLLIKINEVAVRWNKTRDPKDKDLWYKLIKEFNHGIDRTERWNVSVNSVNKADDGTYVISGKRIRPV
jgi:hypothetical protein|tara:strand:+ start:108 stop:323 length:216 start_codon:yes stop_codon:yes gene_type:complete